MSPWTTRACQAANLARLSSPKSAYSTPQAATLIQWRCLAGAGADHHGPPKANFWQDPMNPSKWKEEHAVCDCFFNRGLERHRDKLYMI
ncbi:hypothetical protein CRYUN_Cryun38cG0054000 [Craigia yunnanensis]